MRDNSRIAIYCDCNSRGGVWAYTARLLSLLSDNGFESFLISHPARDDLEKELLAEMEKRADQSLLLPRNASTFKSIRAISKYLIKNRMDIFIPNYRRISYSAAAMTTRRYPLKVIGVCHNDHDSYYSVLLKYRTIISTFICASTKTQRVLQGKLGTEFNTRVQLIPHFVQVDRSKRALYQSDPFTVVYHGRLQEEQKHCSKIIEVAKRACPKNDCINFLLIGDGDGIPDYQKQIEEAELSRNVQILESMPWAELEDVLSRCQLAILTSSYEGFCYGAAEALSLGLPLAAFNCGEVISDFLYDEHNGCVVPWGDVRALSDWIVAVAGDPVSWNRYADNAIAIADKTFSYEKISKRYVQVFDNCIETGEKWPLLRPVFIPEKGKSLRSFIEKKGRKMGVWL